MPENTDTPAKTEYLDTQEIIDRLDREDAQEPELEEKPEREDRRDRPIVGYVFDTLSSSFIVLLINALASVGLFCSVIVLTLWTDCPTVIWVGFTIVCTVIPVILAILNIRLLVRIASNRPAARMTIREL